MVFDDLHQYLDFLSKKKDLLVIDDSVDPEIELTYILSEEQRIGKGRAVLFSNVRGSFVPAVGNLYSTQAKMDAILGGSPTEIGKRLQNLVKIAQGTDSLLSKGFELLRELSGIRPKVSSSLPSSVEVLPQVDLGRYPVSKTWPDDAGRFITLPMVITKDPVTGERNAGMYRLQVFDSETTGMHWHIHKGGAEHMDEYRKVDRMDVAVVIGSDPLTMFSAVAPLPNGLDEFSFTGLISKKRMELVKGQTVDLEYPKNFEIVLEGYVDPSETRIEGPFGDHTGYYSLQEEFPVFHIKKIIERKNRIYPTTIVGKLWQEDVIMGKAIERIFLPLIQTQVPEIVDINTMEEAVFHNMVVVSIRKRFPGHAKKVMFALWGMGQLMFSKIIVIVDSDIDVHDRKQVIWAMTTRIDPQRDVFIIPGAVTDTLDHPSQILNYGSKMGIDATRKGKSEGYNRVWPEVLDIPEELKNSMNARWKKIWS
ncbi:MAG: menaquinone biosynthesis decarboxylase [Thermoplasmataceae archaeon]